MRLMARRGLLMGATAAAGTVAVALALRKLAAPWHPPMPIVHLPAAPEPLRDIAAALRPVEPPRPPPAIRFAAAGGSGRTLADFAGRGVVLNLWATWCVPCDAELPSLDALAAALAADGIVVLPLSSDRGGAATVRQYYDHHRISHLGIWTDPDGAALQALGARGIPTTLILDRQGRERARLEGGVDWAGNNAAANGAEMGGLRFGPKKRLSWLSSVVLLFHDLTRTLAPQGWRFAPPPSAASALTRPGPCQPMF